MAPFSAISCWFSDFKHHYDFQNLQLSGETTSADEKATNGSLAVILNVIEKEGYTLEQLQFWRNRHAS